MSNGTLQARLEALGWHFVQISETEGEWKKFDKDGMSIARQGDNTWKQDLRSVEGSD